jgi:hypothetical protein
MTTPKQQQLPADTEGFSDENPEEDAAFDKLHAFDPRHTDSTYDGTPAPITHDPDVALDLRGAVDDVKALLGNITLADLTNWHLQTSDPRFYDPTSGEMTDQIDGWLIHVQRVRAWWSGAYGTGAASQFPECHSGDSITASLPYSRTPGVGTKFGKGSPANISGRCQTCPMAAFGSKGQQAGTDSIGQACTQHSLIYVLRADPDGEPVGILPDVVWSPISAEKFLRSLTVRAVSLTPGHRALGARIALKVGTTANSNGVRHSTVVGQLFDTGHRLDIGHQVAQLVRPAEQSVAEIAAAAFAREY